MTLMEKRLARRIHNQRVRLRQLEEFSGWQREYRGWTRNKWLHMASKLLRENEQLRRRLGDAGRFDQTASIKDYVP